MTSRRALVTLPRDVWKIIDKEIKGNMGRGDSEVIRNMVVAYLSSQGYMGEPVEPRAKVGSVALDKIAGELDMQDNMVTSLAELLEERGLVDYHEWENRIKKKLVKQKSNVGTQK